MIQLQRLLGNEGVNLLLERNASMQVQREEKDKKPLYQGTPDNPFDLLPQIMGRVEDVAAGDIKSLVGDTIEHAFGEFSRAIQKVQGTLQKEKEEEKKKTEFEFNLAAGIATMFVPTVEIGESIAGNILLDKTRATVEARMSTMVTEAAKESHAAAQQAFELSREVQSALSSEALTRLAAKFSPEKAAEAVKKAGDIAGEQGLKLILSGTHPYDIASSFLDALQAAASESSKKLQIQMRLLTDLSQLVAIYHAFDRASIAYYEPSLTDRAHHFVNQISDLVSGSGASGSTRFLVYLNAYGARRLAEVQLLGRTYSFITWITPDMEQVALGVMGGQPKEMSASQIEGHIPDPVKEVPNDFERVVRINAWGFPRLAIVGGDASWFKNYQSEMKFVRWVRKDEEEAQQARATSQIGGLNDVNPSDVKDLKAPVE